MKARQFPGHVGYGKSYVRMMKRHQLALLASQHGISVAEVRKRLKADAT